MLVKPIGTQINPYLLQSRRTDFHSFNSECLPDVSNESTSQQPNVSITSSTLSMINRINPREIEKVFDLIVIGGGINGCGIARDASERGLKVLLLEKEDFGYGCTSASSRLIHGGLRYLEHFEFDLVRESLRERELLLQNAKHLVRSLELCIPVYKGDKRSYWLIKAGMVLYDLLSFDKSLPRHKMMSKDEFVKHEKGVKSDGLLGVAVYYDAQSHFPERICLENALMAQRDGALVLNHTYVTNIDFTEDKTGKVEFLESITNKKYKVRGKVIVNVAGPWVDSLIGLLSQNIEKKIGGTKGSHIVVKKFDGGPKHAIYATAKSDGRPIFIIPWLNYYLIGTTDISYSGDLDILKAENVEIDYLLREANQILSNKTLVQQDILYCFTGIRPLPYTNKKDPGKITRKHIISDHASDGFPNFISIIGGKLTTYRDLSEQVIDLVLEKLGYKFIHSKTKTIPLIGNPDKNVDIETYKEDELKKIKKRQDLDPEIIVHLIDLYGKRYKELLKLISQNPDLGRLLSSYSLDIKAQVDYAVKNELALTITDVLLRRTTLGFSDMLGTDAIDQVAKRLQVLLDLTQEEINKQIKDYEEKVVKHRKV